MMINLSTWWEVFLIKGNCPVAYFVAERDARVFSSTFDKTTNIRQIPEPKRLSRQEFKKLKHTKVHDEVYLEDGEWNDDEE